MHWQPPRWRIRYSKYCLSHFQNPLNPDITIPRNFTRLLWPPTLYCTICMWNCWPNFLLDFIRIFTYRIRFAKAARVEDFNSRDIYSPERERTLILLSAFINFVKFTEQYCDAFLKDLRDRSDTLIVRREDVTARLNEIQAKVDELTWVHSAYINYVTRCRWSEPKLFKINQYVNNLKRNR